MMRAAAADQCRAFLRKKCANKRKISHTATLWSDCTSEQMVLLKIIAIVMGSASRTRSMAPWIRHKGLVYTAEKGTVALGTRRGRR
jgi:hypothetical protein